MEEVKHKRPKSIYVYPGERRIEEWTRIAGDRGYKSLSDFAKQMIIKALSFSEEGESRIAELEKEVQEYRKKSWDLEEDVHRLEMGKLTLQRELEEYKGFAVSLQSGDVYLWSSFDALMQEVLRDSKEPLTINEIAKRMGSPEEEEAFRDYVRQHIKRKPVKKKGSKYEWDPEENSRRIREYIASVGGGK